MVDVLKSYEMDARTRGLTQKTIITYVGHIRAYLKFVNLRFKVISQTNRIDIRDYIADLRAMGLTSKTISY
ncbi:MAG: site-specific integrase, partial [Methanotrichaceae archaeon]|nr:site-specific integrase [Methanotrichaceae archaeon]